MYLVTLQHFEVDKHTKTFKHLIKSTKPPTNYMHLQIKQKTKENNNFITSYHTKHFPVSIFYIKNLFNYKSITKQLV